MTFAYSGSLSDLLFLLVEKAPYQEMELLRNPEGLPREPTLGSPDFSQAHSP